MNTKIIMTISAFFLGLVGLMLTFAPNEVSQFIHESQTGTITLQITGALYLGFAMTNWMSKENLMGGIYGKPLCIGNIAHFLIGGLALIKFVLNNGMKIIFLVLAVIYLALAISFIYIFFTTPKSVKQNQR